MLPFMLQSIEIANKSYMHSFARLLINYLPATTRAISNTLVE